jgi:hypothetical protein
LRIDIAIEGYVNVNIWSGKAIIKPHAKIARKVPSCCRRQQASQQESLRKKGSRA